MLVGAGALGATDEVIEVADLLGAGVAKALFGKAALPDDLPCVTGSIGLLGTKPSSDMMADCDTLLMVGSSFPYSEFLPEEGKARGVQIDIDGRMIGIRYPMEVQPGRRLPRDAAGADPVARAQVGPLVARGHRGKVARLVEADGGARAVGRRSDQSAAPVLRVVEASAGRRDPHRPTRARRRTGTRATCGFAGG